MRTVLVASLLVASACTRDVPVGDLDLVAISSADVQLDTATAAVDGLVLGPCGGQTETVVVGYRMNLLLPEPLPVPVDTYCGVGVDFSSDPFDGSLRLGGTTRGGTRFRVHLDPGLATRQREVGYTVETEGILALDAALLFDDAAIDALEAMGTDVDLAPDDALAEQLADQVGEALVFFASPDEAAAVYIDLWPDFDLSIDADVTLSGCNNNTVIFYDPPDNTTAEPVEPGEPSDGTDAPGPGDDSGGPSSGTSGCDGSGCQGSGCAGSSGGSDCDCDSGCDAQCATGGFAPVGWVALISFVALRRRRT